MLKKLELFVEDKWVHVEWFKEKTDITMVGEMCGFTAQHFKKIRMKGGKVICS